MLEPLQTPATNHSSFLLHAPLEVLARLRLLRLVDDETGRARVAETLERYERERGLAPSVPTLSGPPLEVLGDAFASGDADLADAAWVSLLDRAPLGEAVGAVMTRIVDLLGAAAHAPILFAEFPHHDLPGLGLLARTAVRDLAANPDARLTWHRAGGLPPRPGSLFERLAGPPRVASKSTFIAPTMLAVEAAGLPRELVGDLSAVSPRELEVELSRIAAWSMLQDDAEHAPYGWTHCLTLPQGLLRAGASVPGAKQVAATYVLGFRATLGAVKLRQTSAPPVSRSQREALARTAVGHQDAHVVKYTLACFDAAALDPTYEGLYFAAAARLHDWWNSEAFP